MMNSSYVYVVSDSYLKPMIKESEKFSFSIKGYCSITQGIKHLKYTNMNDIIGFAIVLDELPEELNSLITLLNKIDLIAKDKPVLLVSVDGNGLSTLMPFINHVNMKFSTLTNFEDMTDTVIKSSIYGYLIKTQFSKYKEDDKKVIPKRGVHKGLQYKPIFDRNILKLNEEVIKAPNLSMALKTDEVLKEFDKIENKVLYFLRKEQIIVKYNGTSNNDKLLNDLLISYKPIDKVNYKSLYKLIKEGRL